MNAGEILQYRYRDAVNGFFEFPTPNARDILPRGLQPVEPHHGSSILAVTAFEFEDSAVGAYREVVLSVVVAPRLLPGEPMPRSAMYPFMVGTTTAAARRHGIEVWKLPHLPADLEVEFDRHDSEVRVTAAEGGCPVLELTVCDPGLAWQPVEHRYQTWSQDGAGLYLSNLMMRGAFMESEEERGSLRLHPHAFAAGIELGEITDTPFREQWMRDGVESIHPLQPLPAFAER
ncbi:MAG: acetoacetate decarboxylase family protein [Candidatus Eisenbacteria bacterium]|nr:acetoacetate decarboxylase family protein [Candidatus Eisenbacteria bacterium]